jgi:NAD(P)-dependent dehydrogenase (short-subunit alcohol dehydrogenase family)
MQDKPVALITGANQGIGLQIAKDLVAHGFTVLVGARNLERGEAAAKEVGPDARAIQLDVTDQASIAAAAERIRKELGRLDVLVNNAAISHTGKLSGRSIAEYVKLTRPSNVSLDEVRAVWETNVFGVLAVYQALAPELRPHLLCVQDGSQCYDARHGDRVGVDRDQGQRCRPGLHQNEPQ